jgi:hypothetical protein
MIGGALGGGVGETAAQMYEKFLGGRKEMSLPQIAAATIIGGLPMGKAAEGVASVGKTLLQQGAKGALMGAGASAIEDVVGKGEMPDPSRAIVGAGLGTVVGGGGALLARKLASRLLPSVTKAVEEPAPSLQSALPEHVDPAEVLASVKKGLGFAPQASAIPEARPRVGAELRSFESVKHLPENVQQDFLDILDQSSEQRRGVQPIARTQALASNKVVSTELLKPGTALNAEEIRAHAEAFASVSQEANDLIAKIGSGQGTAADTILLTQRMEQRRVAALNYSGALTETGRALNAAKFHTQGLQVMDSEMLEQLIQSPKFKGKLSDMIGAIAETKGDPQKQLDLMLKTRPTSGSDKFSSWFYNSILSSAKTPLRKTIGDTANMLTNIAVHPFAVGADVVRHAVTGAPRTISMGEIGPQVFGMLHALPKAYNEAVFILGHGYSNKDVEMFAAKGVKALESMRPEAPGGYATNFPLRNLKAPTAFFHELAYAQETTGRAYAAAKQAGMKTVAEYQKFMSDLIAGTGHESELLRASGEAYAKRATFMDPAGEMTQAWLDAKAQSSPVTKALMTFLLPIVKLPMRVLSRGLETSPAGFAMAGVREGGREGAQAIGRATLGTMALAPFVLLAANGRLSGSGPQSGPTREKLLREGWKPNSIKIGDTWVEYHLAQPYATEMAVAASMFDRFREDPPKSEQEADAAWGLAGRTLAGATRSTLDQSYFAGLSSALQAIQDPSRSGANFMRGIAQDVVPYSGAMRSITQAIDPIVRKPQGMLEDMQVIIPGMSGNVPAKLDAFGAPIIRPGGPLQRGVNPVGISPEKSDPVEELLSRTDMMVSTPRANLKDHKGQPIPMTREDKQLIEQAIGMEHKHVLEPMTSRGRVTDKQIESALRRATTLVDNRAKMLLHAKKPLTLHALAPNLTKAELDRLYALYQGQNQ